MPKNKNRTADTGSEKGENDLKNFFLKKQTTYLIRLATTGTERGGPFVNLSNKI